MKCVICEKYKTTTKIIDQKVICEDCYFQIHGESMLPQCYDRKIDLDEVVIWIKDEKVKCAWCEYGKTAIYVDDLKEWNVFEAILETVNRAKKTHCTECGKVIGHYYRQHFAGRYCSKDWKKYKKDNSKKCLKCGKSLFLCTC